MPPQSVEIVISRFCEDLGWVQRFPKSWPVTIYDKSAAGGRQRIHLGGWSSADGPDRAETWPGAIPLPNVGCESHSHMYHIVERWHTLADTTVFLSGDAPSHIPNIINRVHYDVSYDDPDLHYVPYGEPYTCDADGRPHVDIDFPELREAYRLFYPGLPVPDKFRWHGFGMYLVRRNRIERFPLDTWRAAREWCVTKAASLAMERLYDLMFE